MAVGLVRTLTVIFFSLMNLRCDLLAPDVQGMTDIVYSTSFEKDADTSGWQGYGFALRNEAPANGGKRSLRVAGGCIWPHGLFTLKPLREDSRLIIRCVGKNLAIGGDVSLAIGNDFHRTIHITVQDTVWTTYESTDTLFCPKGSTLNLSLGAGGIVYSAILVDLIEVRKVR